MRAASSKSALSYAVCVSRAYDVMTAPLTTRVIQIHQLFHPYPKNWVVGFPPYFAQGNLDDPQNAQIFVKI